MDTELQKIKVWIALADAEATDVMLKLEKEIVEEFTARGVRTSRLTDDVIAYTIEDGRLAVNRLYSGRDSAKVLEEVIRDGFKALLAGTGAAVESVSHIL